MRITLQEIHKVNRINRFGERIEFASDAETNSGVSRHSCRLVSSVFDFSKNDAKVNCSIFIELRFLRRMGYNVLDDPT